MSSCVWLPIIHFNDVYNLPPNESEPVGGASRFRTALIEACKPLQSPFYEELEPLVLFSGDALSPSESVFYALFFFFIHFFISFSILYFLFTSLFASTVSALPAVSAETKGRHMVDVLDSLGVRCTVVGNHDFGVFRCLQSLIAN